MELKPIGKIHSPYRRKKSPPSGKLSENLSVIEIFDEYAPGLKNVEKQPICLYCIGDILADRSVLQGVTPFSPEATGCVLQPLPEPSESIALCIVDVISIEGNKLTCGAWTPLDGSLLLDIKAYSGTLVVYPTQGSDGKLPDWQLGDAGGGVSLAKYSVESVRRLLI
jgi:formylmethanofuran dehydrogenase subunit E